MQTRLGNNIIDLGDIKKWPDALVAPFKKYMDLRNKMNSCADEYLELLIIATTNHQEWFLEYVSHFSGEIKRLRSVYELGVSFEELSSHLEAIEKSYQNLLVEPKGSSAVKNLLNLKINEVVLRQQSLVSLRNSMFSIFAYGIKSGFSFLISCVVFSFSRIADYSGLIVETVSKNLKLVEHVRQIAKTIQEKLSNTQQSPIDLTEQLDDSLSTMKWVSESLSTISKEQLVTDTYKNSYNITFFSGTMITLCTAASLYCGYKSYVHYKEWNFKNQQIENKNRLTEKLIEVKQHLIETNNLALRVSRNLSGK